MQNVDIYLKLVVDELKTLWVDGVAVEDVSRLQDEGRFFSLRAILLWTMHDYPEYSVISKMQTKGRRGCFVCWRGLVARRSGSLTKMLYDGNFRQHLPLDHPF